MRFSVLTALVVVTGAVLGGCQAYDSLIGHPLHVLHQQHEYNEQVKAEREAEAKTNQPPAP